VGTTDLACNARFDRRAPARRPGPAIAGSQLAGRAPTVAMAGSLERPREDLAGRAVASPLTHQSDASP
jgi:hypothetical protein